MNPGVSDVPSTRYTRIDGALQKEVRGDQVAIEEPLEVRIEHRGQNTSVAVTMRTPGDDVALAAGFLFTEGIIDHPDDLIEIRPCREPGPDGPGGEPVENIVQALLRPDHPFDPERFRRNVYTTSSCGICGKASIDAVEVTCRPIVDDVLLITPDLLTRLPGLLRDAQAVFTATGGLHATALITPHGHLERSNEDVGRHNAMDKVIGAAFLAGELPLSDRLLLVSGRVSFELVQKAARSGVPVIAAIGAPSSLALQAADRLGVTVVGFLGPERFNVYTHTRRVDHTLTAAGTAHGPAP